MTKICSLQRLRDGVIRQLTITCQISNGIGIHLVGLNEYAMKESLLRVVTSLQRFGVGISGKKVIINISPAVNDRNSSFIDLPIAIAMLEEMGRALIPGQDEFYYGEFNPNDGSIRKIGNENALAWYCMGQRRNLFCGENMQSLQQFIMSKEG